MKQLNYICYLSISLIVAGCASSYSPSLSLPTTPLEKGENDFQVSMEGMPYATSEHITELTIGTNFQYGRGLSDRFAIYTRAWIDWLNLPDGGAYGISVGCHYHAASWDKSRLILIPRMGLLYDGVGGALSNGLIFTTAYQYQPSEAISLYTGLGIGIGANLTDFSPDNSGSAAYAHVGCTIGKSKRFNIEITNIVHYSFDGLNEFRYSLSPQIGIGFAF